MSDENAVASREAAVEFHRAWSDQIRATDDISLKLLTVVPTITAVGISLLLPKDPGAQLATPQVMVIGIFGAWISFLVYRWEKRNIQTCGWYRDRMRAVEQAGLAASEGELRRLPDLPSPPAVFKQRMEIGKSRAEFLIYTSVVVAWLALAAYGTVALIWK